MSQVYLQATQNLGSSLSRQIDDPEVQTDRADLRKKAQIAANAAGAAKKVNSRSVPVCALSNKPPKIGPKIEPNRPIPKAQETPVARTSGE